MQGLCPHVFECVLSYNVWEVVRRLLGLRARLAARRVFDYLGVNDLFRFTRASKWRAPALGARCNTEGRAALGDALLRTTNHFGDLRLGLVFDFNPAPQLLIVELAESVLCFVQ